MLVAIVGDRSCPRAFRLIEGCCARSHDALVRSRGFPAFSDSSVAQAFPSGWSGGYWRSSHASGQVVERWPIDSTGSA